MRDPAVAADGHSTVQMLGSCGEATVDETACLASLPAELLGAVLPAAGLVSLASSCSAMRDSMAPFLNGWLERGLDALFRKACGHETAGANLYGARERWSAFVAARRSLALAKCSLRLEEIRLLLHAHRLAPAAGLRHLSLRNNGLGDDATAQLARAIGSGALRWTETLFLCGNHITDLGLRSLVEAVQEGGGGAAAHGGAAAPAPTALCKLHCDNNRLGDGALFHLGACLSRAPIGRLRLLSLRTNGIGDVGFGGLVHRLLGALPVLLPRLPELRLGANRISDAGLESLVEALQEGVRAHPALKRTLQNKIGALDLSENPMGDGALMARFESLTMRNIGRFL